MIKVVKRLGKNACLMVCFWLGMHPLMVLAQQKQSESEYLVPNRVTWSQRNLLCSYAYDFKHDLSLGHEFLLAENNINLETNNNNSTSSRSEFNWGSAYYGALLGGGVVGGIYIFNGLSGYAGSTDNAWEWELGIIGGSVIGGTIAGFFPQLFPFPKQTDQPVTPHAIQTKDRLSDLSHEN